TEPRVRLAAAEVVLAGPVQFLADVEVAAEVHALRDARPAAHVAVPRPAALDRFPQADDDPAFRQGLPDGEGDPPATEEVIRGALHPVPRVRAVGELPRVRLERRHRLAVEEWLEIRELLLGRRADVRVLCEVLEQ